MSVIPFCDNRNYAALIDPNIVAQHFSGEMLGPHKGTCHHHGDAQATDEHVEQGLSVSH